MVIFWSVRFFKSVFINVKFYVIRWNGFYLVKFDNTKNSKLSNFFPISTIKLNERSAYSDLEYSGKTRRTT